MIRSGVLFMRPIGHVVRVDQMRQIDNMTKGETVDDERDYLLEAKGIMNGSCNLLIERAHILAIERQQIEFLSKMLSAQQEIINQLRDQIYATK